MTRVLSNWFTSYAEYTEISEAPVLFDFWTGVTTIAGALRRQTFIDEIKFKIFPNFYVFFVAPPGIATKSTTVGVGMRLLRQIEGVTMGPSSMTWQGLTRGLQNAQQLVPQKTQSIDDLLTQEFLPQACVTCDVSELGTFLDMKDGSLISVLIDLWDGKEVVWERWLASKDDTKIENPLISIVGATTPSWLEENFGEGAIGGGLTSRIIFVYGDKKRRFIPFISDLVDSSQNKLLEEMLVHDLREMSKLKGEVSFTRAAKNIVGEWYVRHWTKPEDHIASSRFDGYRARKYVHLLKLAMILSISESDDLIIDVPHIQKAFAFLTGIEVDLLKVMDSIGKVASSKQMDTVLSVVRTRSKIEKFQLWRSCMNSMSQKEFGEAIDGLVQAGYIAVRNEAGAFFIHYTRKAETEPFINKAAGAA